MCVGLLTKEMMKKDIKANFIILSIKTFQDVSKSYEKGI